MKFDAPARSKFGGQAAKHDFGSAPAAGLSDCRGERLLRLRYSYETGDALITGLSPIQAASLVSIRLQISTRALTSSRIISGVWVGPGVKRSLSVPRGTVG